MPVEKQGVGRIISGLKRCFFGSLFGFLCGFSFLSAQSPKIDSLTKALRYQKDDTNKVITLWKLSDAYLDVGLNQKGLHWAEEALVLAKVLDYPLGIGDAAVFCGLGEVELGKYDLALSHYKEAMQCYQSVKKWNSLGAVYNNIGIVYDILSDYPKALYYFLQSIEMYKKANMVHRAMGAYHNIGIIYERQKKYDKHLAILREAIAVNHKMKNKKWELINYKTYADVMLALDSFPKAEQMYRKSIALSIETDNRRGHAMAMNGLSELYSKQKKWKEALVFSDSAMMLFRKVDEVREYAYSLLSAVKINMELRQMEKAKALWKKVFALSDSLPVIALKTECYAQAMKMDSLLGDTAQYVEHYKLFNRYKDSSENVEKERQFAQINMNYSFEQKELKDSLRFLKLNMEQASVLKKQYEKLKNERWYRNYLFVLLALLFLGLLFAISRYKRMIVQGKRLKELEQELADCRSVMEMEKQLFKHNEEELRRYKLKIMQLEEIIKSRK